VAVASYNTPKDAVVSLTVDDILKARRHLERTVLDFKRSAEVSKASDKLDVRLSAQYRAGGAAAILDAFDVWLATLAWNATCDRHHGPWGKEASCPRCTGESGYSRPLSNPGPLA
jgi:hypothetical protein